MEDNNWSSLLTNNYKLRDGTREIVCFVRLCDRKVEREGGVVKVEIQEVDMKIELYVDRKWHGS
jgi:hypothetical protein